ncbi:MAG: glycerol-3-phosphate dehydrogenase subunit GlpB [Propionibacteriaceae bacterium]|jgi:glycerol-3-phosphate dehydrogenase subunit B|nr:glycerol-3-phosphate dehydrogenase subunit GlpB [Propionibacteriaceae bacterium]
MAKAVVIGAGLAGLTAAIRLGEVGFNVTLLAAGYGGLPLSPGTVDVFGYAPKQVADPLQAASEAPPPHPYAVIGAERLRSGLEWIANSLGPEFLVGAIDRNWLLPTAAGALRPTCLAPPSMAAGQGQVDAVIGFAQLKDFPAALVAGNLGARPVILDFPARDAEAECSSVVYARAFDDPGFRERFAAAARPLLRPGERVALPAVLGSRDTHPVREVSGLLQAEVFEVATVPPSVPGLRLNAALLARARAAGVRMVNGSRAVGFSVDKDRISAVEVAAAGSPEFLRADAFVLATGGFESQGLVMDSHGVISEPLFGLPVAAPQAAAFAADFWADHPLLRAGVRVDSELRPVDADAGPVHSNLRAVGGVIGGANRIRELSGDGIAIGSAWAAAESLRRMK